MKKKDLFKKKPSEEENGWSSVSDLMSGLMIVFLLIAVSFMIKVDSESENAIQTSATVKNILDAYNKSKKTIYDDLVVAFEDKANEWNMKIDEKDGTIRFEEPDVLFADNEDSVKDEFKNILNEFFPKYIDTIYKNHKDSIKEIRIEGHTSSKWTKDSSQLNAFSNNMKLSQDRTRAVMDYVMSIPDSKQYEEWLRKHMTANGMSSSRPIVDSNGKEDPEKSRRVEFRIVTNAEDVIGDILKKGYSEDN